MTSIAEDSELNTLYSGAELTNGHGVEMVNSNDTASSSTRSSSSSSAAGPTSWRRINSRSWKRVLEVVVLSCVVLVVWGGFSVPTIVYAVSPLQVSHSEVKSSVPRVHRTSYFYDYSSYHALQQGCQCLALQS